MLAGALVTAATAPRLVHGAPPSGSDDGDGALALDLPQLQYAGDWNPRPGALRELGIELRLRTRLAPKRIPSVVEATDPRLFETPLLWVAGRRSLPSLGATAELALRRFVDFGGMLVFDDADGGTEPGFQRDVTAMLERVVPGGSLTPIGTEHVLYRSFYIIDTPMGRTAHARKTLGIQEEGRIKVLFLPDDVLGTLARTPEGSYAHTCRPGGDEQREWGVRLAINVLLYATCTDYKSDRAHVETLESDRRWK